MTPHNQPPSQHYLACRKAQLARLDAALEKLPEGNYVLELGCGHGHFLTALAAKERAEGKVRCYAGVDKNDGRIERANRKTTREGVEVCWVNAYVEDALAHWPKGRVVEEIFVLFPDPWPRGKQAKHRFVNAETLKAMAELVPSGGKFFFRSDHLGYCENVAGLLAASKEWKPREVVEFPQGLPRTVFEGHHPQFGTIEAWRG